jgi:hypothetical protein
VLPLRYVPIHTSIDPAKLDVRLLTWLGFDFDNDNGLIKVFAFSYLFSTRGVGVV